MSESAHRLRRVTALKVRDPCLLRSIVALGSANETQLKRELR